MLNKITKLFLNPKKYLVLAVKIFEQYLCYLFANTAFFLQGQMDINPKSRWYDQGFSNKIGGFFIPHDKTKRIIIDLQPWDLVRRDMIILLLRSIIERNIKGNLAELGVHKGTTAKLIHHYVPDRTLYLFDTFCGINDSAVHSEKTSTGLPDTRGKFNDTSLEDVLRYIKQRNDNVRIYSGHFPNTVNEELNSEKFAFVHLDFDLYESTLDGLNYFYTRVSPGGFILVHDYNAWPGARRAVNDFFYKKTETPIPMPDKSGSALIIKLPRTEVGGI